MDRRWSPSIDHVPDRQTKNITYSTVWAYGLWTAGNTAIHDAIRVMTEAAQEKAHPGPMPICSGLGFGDATWRDEACTRVQPAGGGEYNGTSPKKIEAVEQVEQQEQPEQSGRERMKEGGDAGNACSRPPPASPDILFCFQKKSKCGSPMIISRSLPACHYCELIFFWMDDKQTHAHLHAHTYNKKIKLKQHNIFSILDMNWTKNGCNCTKKRHCATCWKP